MAIKVQRVTSILNLPPHEPKEPPPTPVAKKPIEMREVNGMFQETPPKEEKPLTPYQKYVKRSEEMQGKVKLDLSKGGTGALGFVSNYSKNVVEPNAAFITQGASKLLPGEQEVERKYKYARNVLHLNEQQAANYAYQGTNLPSVKSPFSIPIPNPGALFGKGPKVFHPTPHVGVKGLFEIGGDPSSYLPGVGFVGLGGKGAKTLSTQASRSAVRSIYEAGGQSVKYGARGGFQVLDDAARGGLGSVVEAVPDGLPGTVGALNYIDNLVQTKTAAEIANPNLFQQAKDDISKVVGRFRHAAPPSDQVKEVRDVLIQYNGDVTANIPNIVNAEVRDLRNLNATLHNAEPKVAKGVGRLGAVGKQVAGDEDIPLESKKLITLALSEPDIPMRQAFINKMSPEDKQFYDVMRTKWDDLGKWAVQNGLIDEQTRAAREGYYVHQLWNMAEEGKNSVFGGTKSMTRRAPEQMVRTIEGFRAGIDQGLIPETLDNLTLYEKAKTELMQRATAIQVIKDIRTQHPGLVDYHKVGDAIPEGFQRIDHPLFDVKLPVGNTTSTTGAVTASHQWVVADEVAPFFKAIFEPSLLRQHGVSNAILKTSAFFKRSLLGGVIDANMLGFSAKNLGYTVGPGKAASIGMASLKSLGRPDIRDAQLNALIDIGARSTTKREALETLYKHGLTSSQVPQEYVRALGKDTPKPLLGYVIPGYARGQEIVEDVTFAGFIKTWKEDAALELMSKNAGKMSLDKAAELAANDVNKAIGGLNRIRLGRSQTTQDFLNLMFIAPDWFESRLRFFGSAFVPGADGSVARGALGRQIALGGMYVITAEVTYGERNGLSEDEIIKNIEDRLNPIHKNKDGEWAVNPDFMQGRSLTGQRSSLLTFELNPAQIFLGAAAYAAGDTETGDILLLRNAKSRLGIAPRIGVDIVANKDWKEQPIATSDNPWGRAGQYLYYEAGALGLPATVQELGRVGMGTQTPLGATQNVTGLGRSSQIQEMPDKLKRFLSDKKLDATRVNSFYDLSKKDQREFLEANPDVSKFLTEKKIESPNPLTRQIAEIKQMRFSQEASLEQEVTNRSIGLPAFARRYDNIQEEMAQSANEANRAAKLYGNEPPADPLKRAVFDYYKAYKDAKIAGGLDFELLESRMADLERQWSPEQKQYVADNTQQTEHQGAWGREYEKDKDIIKQAGYWDAHLEIPEVLQHPLFAEQYDEYRGKFKNNPKAFELKYGERRLEQMKEIADMVQEIREAKRAANPELEAALVKWYNIGGAEGDTLQTDLGRKWKQYLSQQLAGK